MTEWVRVAVGDRCGSCRHEIPGGAICLKIRPATAAHVVLTRCTACARGDYGDAPATVESDNLAPQPSLPLDVVPTRRRDFVRFDHGHAKRVRAEIDDRARDYRERQAND